MTPIFHWASKLPLAAVIFPLLLATSAPAATVYSGVKDIAIPNTFDGVYLDITTSGYTTHTSEPTNWDVNFFFGGIGIAYSDTFQPFVDDKLDNLSQILNVQEDTVIGGTNATDHTLSTTSYGGSGSTNQYVADSHFDANPTHFTNFVSGAEGYIAFVLYLDSTTYYGWMRVTLYDDGTEGTIHDWAYSTNSNFEVGMIPEPTTALLGALGVLLLLRRRR